MKKLILGIMLLMGSLSFSSKEERGLDNHDYENLKIKTEVSDSNQGHSYKNRLLFGNSSENRD